MSWGEGYIPNEIFNCDFYSYVNAHIEKLTDLKNQYIELMSELTVCEQLDNETFYRKLKEIDSMGKIIIACKSTDGDSVEIVGSGTIIIEPKIIRGTKSVGHIEDIVVKSSYRGKKIAQSILNELKEYAKISDCYKVILDCDEKVCPVYMSNGFETKGIQMGLYF
jgi:glucosamine-phosphate N-acetyltransferase